MNRKEAARFAMCLKHNWTIDFNRMEEFCDRVLEAFELERRHVRKMEAQRKELRRFNATTPEYRLQEEFERGRNQGFNEAMAEMHKRDRPVHIVVSRAYQQGRNDALKELEAQEEKE